MISPTHSLTHLLTHSHITHSLTNSSFTHSFLVKKILTHYGFTRAPIVKLLVEAIKTCQWKVFIYSIVYASFQVTEVFLKLKDIAKNVKFSSHERNQQTRFYYSLLLLSVLLVFFFQNYSMPFFNKKRIAFKVYWLPWWDTMKIDKRCIVVGRSVTYSSVLNVVKIYINNDGNFASLLIKILYPLCTHY